jgi:hypothetical protein
MQQPNFGLGQQQGANPLGMFMPIIQQLLQSLTPMLTGMITQMLGSVGGGGFPGIGAQPPQAQPQQQQRPQSGNYYY